MDYEDRFHLPFLQWGHKCLCSHGILGLFHFSVTTPGTEMSETQKATGTSGSPTKTPEEIVTPPEEERLYLQTPTSSERGGSPVVQEPEEPPESREASSPRKTSLVIVESAEDQPQAFEKLDEDAAFQKVKSPPLSLCPRGTKLHTLSHVLFSSDLFFSQNSLPN